MTPPTLREVTRLLWAVQVIWEWSRKHEEATPPAVIYHRYLSKVDGGECPQWRVPVPFADGDGKFRGIGIEAFSTPEAATIALAEGLVRQDPSLAAWRDAQGEG